MKSDFRTTLAMSLALMIVGSALAAQQTKAATQTAGSDGTPTVITSQPSTPPVTDSQVRIVRLSEVRGEVQIDRNTGQGFEPALLNLPVTQGSTLHTGAGVAEIEFEDNSTLRLTPNTILQFPQLELLPSGAKASTVNVQAGTVYLSLARTKGDEFRLTFAHDKLTLTPSSHIRLHLGHTKARLAVMGGSVQVEEPTGTMTAGRKQTLTFDLANQTAPILAKNVVKGQYDSWDQSAIDYHRVNAKSSSYASSSNVYGISDMNYYGEFVNVAGCARIWRPYFASPGWDPFATGTWAWYPGSGYSWVSPYPWGWTPYHSGAWQYCPAYGWGWRPSSSWVGLKNQPPPRQPTHGFPPVPRPPVPPTHGIPTLVAVNREPAVASGLSSPDRFVIRRDSAGLGIPRGTLGNLGHMSGRVEQRGSANLTVYSAPVATGVGNGKSASSGSISSAGRTSAERLGASGYAGGRSGGENYASAMEHASSGGDTGHSGGGSMSTGGGSTGGGGGERR
jgi:hypothetical protein